MTSDNQAPEDVKHVCITSFTTMDSLLFMARGDRTYTLSTYVYKGLLDSTDHLILACKCYKCISKMQK